MTKYVGLDVSQKTRVLCIVDGEGHRLWRGECTSSPDQIVHTVLQHAGAGASIGLETGPMTPWLVHELRSRGLDVIRLDARHARAALRMQLNKTDRNDAEGLAQIMRTGWFRAVHVKSFDAHRARALLGARQQLVGMVTRLSNHIRGVLKTFGMLPGSVRGRSFAERVELLVAERLDVAPIVLPMLAAWSKLREQIAAFDKAIRAEVKESRECRLLMSVSWHWSSDSARVCQRHRAPRPISSITLGGRAPGTHPQTISIGRCRPQRTYIEVWRHAISALCR
jgi:transposase